MAVIFPGREGSGNWAGVAFDPKLGYIFGTTAFNAGQTGRIVKADHPNPQGGPYDKVFPGGPSRYGSRSGTEKWLAVHSAAVGRNLRGECEDGRDRVAQAVRHGRCALGKRLSRYGRAKYRTDDRHRRRLDLHWRHQRRPLPRVRCAHRQDSVDRKDRRKRPHPAGHLTGKNGKQYVVVEAFGGPGIVAINGYFNDAPGDSVIAFALP